MDNKFLMGMLLGGLLGAGVTYAYLDKRNTEMQQRAEDAEYELETLKAQNQEASDQDRHTKTAEELYQESLPTVAELLKANKEREEATQKVIHKYTPYSDAEKIDDETINEEREKEKAQEPSLISESEYLDNHTEREKFACSLYLKDMVAVDDHGDELDDPDYRLGKDNIQTIKDQYKPDENEMFWISNPTTGIDYEVEVIDDYYTDPE